MDIEDLGMKRATLRVRRVNKPDTNCNDLVRVTVSVNGRLYCVTEMCVNTQQDLRKLKHSAEQTIQNLDLRQLSSFGN